MNGQTFVDSCVILDVFTDDPVWGEWSSRHLFAAAERGLLVINALIYAEVSVRHGDRETLDLALSDFEREDVPYEAAFLAGKVQADYRARGGKRSSLLPDFLIGAHAMVRGHRLLTRDPKRFANAFPALRLIAPGTA